MKIMKFKAIIWMAGLMACSLLMGCEEDPAIEGPIAIDDINGNGSGNGTSNGTTNSSNVKQVDIKVVVPIHPSSLKYFDYIICYSDNTGEEYRDTLSERRLSDNTGEVHRDTIRKDNLQDVDIYYTTNFCYKRLPVICRCEVTLVPKVSRDSVVSFSYITPKPFIFSRVIFDSHSYTPETGNANIEEVTVINIDNARIGDFLSTYGSWFCSTCYVKGNYDGVSTSFD